MFISQADFIAGCTRLRDEWQRGGDASGAWEDVRLRETLGTEWLRITRVVDGEPAQDSEASHADAAVEEEDEEALPTAATRTPPLLVYDVVHSPSYQVPVLYITFKDTPWTSPGLPALQQVYEMLVPAAHRSQLHGVGPMGALSVTDHPVHGTPAYFVHPCRTAEAMDAVAGGAAVEALEYLLRWIGAIGQSVGLVVPVQLAQVLGAPGQSG